MKEKILSILTKVQNGSKAPIQAQKELLDLFGVSYSSILHGGDNLSEYGENHRDSCERIKSVLIANGFINAGLNDALGLWGEYSDSYAAGWLGLPDNDAEIFDCIKGYIKITHYCF